MSAKLLQEMFLDALQKVHPANLLPGYLRVSGDHLVINNRPIPLAAAGKLIVIACGKASAAMALEAEKILGGHITDGICIVKYGHALPLQRLFVLEAGHPYPDENSVLAGEVVTHKLSSLEQNDLVLLLLSGGASALMSDLPPGCTAGELQQLNRILVNSGAAIHEINGVRKHLSQLKGGHLSRLAYPASVHTLIISDVPGDRPADIASGPTAADPTSFTDALAVLEKYRLRTATPPSIIRHLEKGRAGLLEETLKSGSVHLSRTFNTIMAGNQTLLSAAAVSASGKGLFVIQAGDLIEGDLNRVAKRIADTLTDHNGPVPCCFLWGGEPTVRVTGKGLGGRNQHLALSILKELRSKQEFRRSFSVLCAGSDGTDGPTDAAGAIIDSAMPDQKEITDRAIEAALNAFDSNTFFREYGGLLKTGPTQTNVMDVVMAIRG